MMEFEKSGFLPCSFCLEEKRSLSEKTLTFLADESFFALPSLGCFTLGYSLVVPRVHVRSFSDLTSDGLSNAAKFLEVVRDKVEKTYGPCLIAEHGTGDDEVSAACCDHAHIHVIPIQGHGDAILSKYQSAGGGPTIMRSLQDLHSYKLDSYILASVSSGEFLLWKSSKKFIRQFARIVSAEALDVGEFYNWRVHTFWDNMVKSYIDLRSD